MAIVGTEEAESLERHILKKAGGADESRSESLAVNASGAGGEPEPESENGVRSFVEFRFTAALIRNSKIAPRYRWFFTGISVVTIAAGLTSSALANADPKQWAGWITALGLIVGVLTAINQILMPGQRSVARHRAATAMRNMGWDFVHDRGHYRNAGKEERLGLFIDEVGRINRGVEAVDETAAQGQTS